MTDVRTDTTPTSRTPGLTRRHWIEVAGPAVILVALSYGGSAVSPGLRFFAEGTLATLVIVLALQLFVGNSGVLSFGHATFALVGGFTAGLLTMPAVIKANVLPELLPVLQSAHAGIVVSLGVAMLLSGIVAGLLGLFLMRLNGLAAGIATFGVLMVGDNIFFNSRVLGPGPQVMPQIPKFDYFDTSVVLAVGSLLVVYVAGTSRAGRLLRASREDELAVQSLGVSVWRLRVPFFALSGALAGLAGAMYAHHAAAVSARDFFLDYTFMTLAMLIIGGSRSVWGAVVGTLSVAAVSQVLLEFEGGVPVGDLMLTAPPATRPILTAVALVVILLWRPQGLTGGREFRLPRLGRRSR